jgi:membrane dipeptidase
MPHAVRRRHAALALLIPLACDPAPAPAPAGSASVATPAQSASASAAPVQDPHARAVALAKKFIIVDGHVDLPYRLDEAKREGKPEDVRERTDKGDFDWARAQAGGFDAPFMSIYVPASYQKKGGAKAYADELIDLVEGICRSAPEKFSVARSPAEVVKNTRDGKVSFPMGIENGAAIEGKLENLAHFHGRGVRYITLTHSEDNDICDSSYDKRHTHKGLSPFGKQVVAEMNRLGIMIDVSHISDDAFWQVMDETRTPVIASHSSCRHFTPGFERNMSDDMIKKLAAGGGVILINYGSTFLTAEARAWSDKLSTEREAFMKESKLAAKDDPKVEAWVKKWEAEHPLPRATVKAVADHIEHVIALVGVEHVGLGSDFDGVGDSLPSGLKDASEVPNLIEELLARGHSEGDIEKICSGNVLRVWLKVEAFAAELAHH